MAASSGLPFPWIRHLTPQIVSISLQTTEASAVKTAVTVLLQLLAVHA